MPTESLPDVLARLNELGFCDQCRADGDGIHFMRSHTVYPPEELIVEDVVRLEGTSAPDEQIAIYALVSPDGNLRGSYTVPHGFELDPLDAEAIRRLPLQYDHLGTAIPEAEQLHVQY